MKDLTLSQQYALLALDGQESIHPSVAKSAVLRAVSAAQVLETELGKELFVRTHKQVDLTPVLIIVVHSI